MNEACETHAVTEILTHVKESHCGSISYVYMYIPDRDCCDWLHEEIETANSQHFSVERQLHTCDSLASSGLPLF